MGAANTFLTLISEYHQATNALNEIQLMIISVLRISARGCQPQGVFQIKEIQVQHTNLGIISLIGMTKALKF